MVMRMVSTTMGAANRKHALAAPDVTCRTTCGRGMGVVSESRPTVVGDVRSSCHPLTNPASEVGWIEADGKDPGRASGAAASFATFTDASVISLSRAV
jgi:hypothetical protein